MLKNKLIIDAELFPLDSVWCVLSSEGTARIFGTVKEVTEDYIELAYYTRRMGNSTVRVSVEALLRREKMIYEMSVSSTDMMVPGANAAVEEAMMKRRGEAFTYAVRQHMELGDIMLSEETMDAVVSKYEKEVLK